MSAVDGQLNAPQRELDTSRVERSDRWRDLAVDTQDFLDRWYAHASIATKIRFWGDMATWRT